ncbi:unnamed protein product [Mytilus edulis]|uniref:Uncharacterized protein n=1 Tax=Mytilus edulis TaxID=6550 RepID=A0A8S3Q0J2_MYTED|nr:unnamed protein product [Mytilus edulis]
MRYTRRVSKMIWGGKNMPVGCDSAQIKTYHFYKDQIPRLIKRKREVEAFEQQSKQLLEQKEKELKTLEDTNEEMTKENETLHGLLDDIERQKDKEIKRLEDTHKVMKVEKESLQDQLSDIQSRLKLSGNKYKDVLEEKEIELKRLEDRHVVMKAEKKSLQDLLNDTKAKAEKQSLQDLLNKSDNKFKLSEKQFKQILEENGKEIKRLQDTHIVMKAEKRSLQDLLNDIKSQLEKEKLKSKEWVKLSEIHSKEILEKKERQFKRLEAEKESLQYIVNDLNPQ